LSIISVVVSLVTIQGCSVHRVFNTPGPVDVERVKVGERRQTIISVLGAPKSSEVRQDGRSDIYEFVDGYSDASKTRAILYIAGDVFTLCLAEIIFWPMEMAVANGTAGRAFVDYGMDNLAKSVLITQTDGKPWEFDSPHDGAKPDSAIDKK
jgi:hypothetical protein